MKRIVLPDPPEETKEKIVKLLDDKCSKIDAAINEQEIVLEKLGRLRESVICEKTTGGIRANRKLTPSGHPWIADIPVEWCSRKCILR